jgi:hypothetical protein
MGWTVIRATTPADAEADGDEPGDGFSADVRAELASGAQIAIELGPDPVEDLAVHETLLSLQAEAIAAGARIVVVIASGIERARLTGYGVTDVHESLDAALGSEAPVLREAQRHAVIPPLAPAMGDTVIVAVEDLGRA